MKQLSDLVAFLRSHGASPEHERQVLRQWINARPQSKGRRGTEGFLPKALMQVLPGFETVLDGLAVLRSAHPGEDGSERLLVALADGQTVESVLLLRDGLCVSSQVGCAVGCQFCMTGRDGLLRQLGSAEIAAQVVLARRRRAVKKVVFMGMGEPSHNLDNVLDAIQFLGTAGGIGHKHLVFSTVGDRRAFERLPKGEVKPALALSLHTTKADLRAQLLPRAPAIDPEELIELGATYAESTGYPLQVQWTLMAGVNDGAEEIESIIRLLRGRYAMLNLIPWNTVEGAGFSRPAWEAAAEMARQIHAGGVLTKLRRSAGQDVDAGCGQLRSRENQVQRGSSGRRIPVADLG